MPYVELSGVEARRGFRPAKTPANFAIAFTFLLSALSAWASGPRWVTGPPYFTGPAGKPVVWYTAQPHYFTDPGDLSSLVAHADADALVAAAAAVWNVPTSAIVIGYGGSLDEHVSTANSYLGSNGVVFPPDVQSSNYSARQIAVIYDSDGSITDLLMGGGASDPGECRQNGVTESVDSFSPAGEILHAVLILNGRCTGSAPQKQLQMQYQLERAFGRVLGVGWSQTNDNVFTRIPQPSYMQALHWPIMHPIDIVCGPYTYLCLPQPFTLRDDDVAAITTLYPFRVWDRFPATPPAPDKQWSYQQASVADGTISFPTSEGMQGVNVVLQRQQGNAASPEGWGDVSSVSGFLYQQNGGNPVTGRLTGIAGSMGSTDPTLQGYYSLGWIPDIDPPGSSNGPMTAVLTTEPINPLYIGPYAVGPYVQGSVSPSGNAQSLSTNNLLQPYLYGWSNVVTNFAPANAAGSCNTESDGAESAPRPVAANGWWRGVICARGHAAWSSFTLQAGRTASIEVTALDEGGLATTAKAMPLIGAWAMTDATGILPTQTATPSAFNATTLGMTAARVSTNQTENLRFVIADLRGDGRPDFGYRARVLYADSIQPAITSLSGGQITISGMGFRAGNELLVNGVPAAVTNWTETAIVAVAPPVTAFGSNPTGAVDVAVVDLSTNGSTVMTGVLNYLNVASDMMTIVSAPSGTFAVGTVASQPFAVRMLLDDGVTPVVGLPVTFSVFTGSARLGICDSSSCVALTDTNGIASTTVTATTYGTVTLLAAAVGAVQSASFRGTERSISPLRKGIYVAAGATVNWSPQVSVMQDGLPAAGVEVDWTASGVMAVSVPASVTDILGQSQASAITGPLTGHSQASVQACVWVTVCTTFTAIGVDPSEWQLGLVSGTGQTVALSGQFKPIVLMVTDQGGNPVAGATITVHQTANAFEMPCPDRGRCPLAPVLGSWDSAATSDLNGFVTITPMQLAGVAEVTNIAVAAGTQGFTSLSLVQGP